MLSKRISAKISMGILMLVFLVVPQLSYADWGVGINFGGPGPGYHHDDHFFYRYHDHPHFGVRIGFLPMGYVTVWSGPHRYYYYDGLYYNYVGGGEYVLVAPPIGVHVSVIPPDFEPVLINGVTYYTDNGIYYILTRHHGYKVVAAPVVYAQVATSPVVAATQDAFPVNIPNNSGGYTTVVIKKSVNGFVGPQGEFYAQFPSVAQLKAMYGK